MNAQNVIQAFVTHKPIKGAYVCIVWATDVLFRECTVELLQHYLNEPYTSTDIFFTGAQIWDSRALAYTCHILAVYSCAYLPMPINKLEIN